MSDGLCRDDSALGTLTPATRNRYFYGKLLDALHLELEQSYGNRKRWMLNRLALGSGVLCGLDVTPTKDGTRIVVGSGVAIDPFGREIVVPAASVPIDPRQPTDDCGNPKGAPLSGKHAVTLCLAYHECLAEPVPALVCDCDTQAGCEASSIRERYTLVIRNGSPPSIDPTCGMPGLFGPGGLDYEILARHVSQSCPTPDDGCVVLGQIAFSGPKMVIDITRRPVVYSNRLLFETLLCGLGSGPSSPTLTRVASASWTHGGTMTVGDFLDNGLTVTFTATLPSKASREWWVVTLEVPDPPSGTAVPHRVQPFEFGMKPGGGSPPALMEAYFKPTKSLPSLGNPADWICRVVLKCNEMLDDNLRAVDGDFLGGAFPSGDGVAGGDFESWFRLGSSTTA